jgi:hypothetical protein
MPDCTQQNFLTFLSSEMNAIQNDFSSYLNVLNASKIYSFGTIFSNRGSVRITLPELSLDADTQNANVVFSTCTAKNLAIINIPIISNTVHVADVRLRYSGESITDQDYSQSISISGTLLLTYEITTKIILQRPSLDINLRGQWTNPFSEWTPATEALETIKLNSFLDDFIDSLTKDFNAKKMQTLIRTRDKALFCSLPSFVPMTCTSSTRVIPSACHPCDTCCNCMVRQTCGPECSGCPCVNCKESWYIWFFSILFLLSSFLIIRTFYY